MRRASLADADLVNSLLGRDFPGVDFSEVLAEPMHVCLIEGGNGAIFAWRGPGTYEGHVFFEARGREALTLGRSMLNAMVDMYGAERFWTLIPLDNRKAKMFVRLLGWKPAGVMDTRYGPSELFVLEN